MVSYKKAKSRRYPGETTMLAYYADYEALFANTSAA